MEGECGPCEHRGAAPAFMLAAWGWRHLVAKWRAVFCLEFVFELICGITGIRGPWTWCHEVRFRCLLPRAPVGQDDGSLSKLPQTNTEILTRKTSEKHRNTNIGLSPLPNIEKNSNSTETWGILNTTFLVRGGSMTTHVSMGLFGPDGVHGGVIPPTSYQISANNTSPKQCKPQPP